MPNKAFRGVLNGVGAGLMVWGLFAAFWTIWFWVIIAVGAVLLIVAGLADWIARESDGFAETVFGDRVNVIQFPDRRDDLRAVWPADGGIE